MGLHSAHDIGVCFGCGGESASTEGIGFGERRWGPKKALESYRASGLYNYEGSSFWDFVLSTKPACFGRLPFKHSHLGVWDCETKAQRMNGPLGSKQQTAKLVMYIWGAVAAKRQGKGLCDYMWLLKPAIS